MNYDYLKSNILQILVQALKLVGKEIGTKHSDEIMYQRDLVKNIQCDEIPWCGLFVAYV
jgi:hypothetical protein